MSRSPHATVSSTARSSGSVPGLRTARCLAGRRHSDCERGCTHEPEGEDDHHDQVGPQETHLGKIFREWPQERGRKNRDDPAVSSECGVKTARPGGEGRAGPGGRNVENARHAGRRWRRSTTGTSREILKSLSDHPPRGPLANQLAEIAQIDSLVASHPNTMLLLPNPS